MFSLFKKDKRSKIEIVVDHLYNKMGNDYTEEEVNEIIIQLLHKHRETVLEKAQKTKEIMKTLINGIKN
jgi:hypothetical protein